ncbi:MAG: hypothetical protein OdinLCB4_000655 [Candidatus Odinarchaeum yellowstonii]|uniref:Tetratricopeptide repeat protein n=1 Tax=Odinarchaeota yellowstonii (strain LCB_4) TaxID=1841599 RepID=A0AAF0D2G0_ODILC|nr:MAG: hypothetical protein OdinLCB4_000655 [Candidatus Odinarchaeum yellowstonii]
MQKSNRGDYNKFLKKAYDAENKAFKQWDKSNFLKSAEFFKESSEWFEKAMEKASNLDEKVLTKSNFFVELSNHYWVSGLKKYSDEENYEEAAELFKKAILNKKKALEADREDLPLRKGLGGQKELKRREWRLFQQSTLRELYAYYFLSLGLKAEKEKKTKIALENFENAAASYNQQIKYLKNVGKPFYLVQLYLLKTLLKIAQCKKELNKLNEAINEYKSIIEQIERMNKRYKTRAEAILALANAELGECYKDLDRVDEAVEYYWKFLNWAKKVKLDSEQSSEVARCICIVTLISIKLGKRRDTEKAIKEFKAGKIFGKNIEKVQKEPWYKLAALIAEYYNSKDERILKDAKLVYEQMIDKKDRYITKFFEKAENT